MMMISNNDWSGGWGGGGLDSDKNKDLKKKFISSIFIFVYLSAQQTKKKRHAKFWKNLKWPLEIKKTERVLYFVWNIYILASTSICNK